MIELVVSISVLISFISGLLVLFYYAFSFYSVRLELERALLCVHQKQVVATCQAEVKEQIQSLLPIGWVEKVLLEKHHHRLVGLLSFRISDSLLVEDLQELPLPLIEWPQSNE